MASWHGQLSGCQFRLLNLSPCPRPRPHDSDPVLTVTQPPPRPPAAPHPDARPLTLAPSEILDRELQEAFQECEEQMASLGIFHSTEPRSVVPQMVPDIQEKTGEAMVNKSNASSSQPPVVVQPEHSSGGHGNKHTHGNSEAANSQKDTVVFSFRNYILGTGSSTGAPEIETGFKVTENLDKCSEIEPEKEKEIDKQKDTAVEASETQTDAPITGQIDDQRQEHTDSDAASGEKANTVIKTVIREEVTEAVTEITGSKEENYSDGATINICIAENGSKGDSVRETQECIHLHLKDTGALSETQTGAHNHTEEEEQLPKTHIWRNSLSDKEVEPDKKAKKKEKRKKRKKKKMEKSTATEQEVRETVQQPESDLQAVLLLDAGNHTDSEANIQSVSQAGSQAVICVAQPNNGSEYGQQLSPGGTPSFTPPLSSSPSRQDHLTYSACSPASSQALSQKPHQSDSCTHTHTPCGMNHCSEQHAAVAMTYVQPTAVRPSASADKTSDAETQEAIVTSGAAVLTQESQSTLSNSQNCVGESALEEVLVPVAALPLTTPTMPEVIESKGEGESARRDTLKRVATVAIAESEKAAGEEDLCFSYVDGGKERLLDSLPQLSLISSQGKCTLAFSAAEGQAESEESCSSKMPHNSAETETKGQRETNVYSSDTEVSSAEEGAKEKEALCLEASIDTSPHGVLTGPDRQDDRAVRLEGAGVGGGAEAIEKKGGCTREHSSLSQPEGSAGGVSSAQTETRPPTDVAESPLKPQCWSELIPAIPESLCAEKLRLSEPSQEQHAAASSPLHTHPEQSLSNTNGGVRADLNTNLVPEEALSLGHIYEEPSITETEKNYFPFLISPQPPAAPQQLAVDRQASNSQQVQPESSTIETRTAEGASEFQALTQLDRGSPVMSGGGLHVCNSSGRSNKVHFADTVKQEGSSFVDLRNMALLATDCASLPPLTVHESLHHPVVEVSYTFPDFLSLKKPERPTNAVLPKEEAAVRTSADLTKPQKDVQLDKGDSELNIGQSGNKKLETDTVGLQSVTAAHSKPSQKGNDECFEADHQTARATKQLEAEAEKGRVTAAQLHAESEQLPELPLVSDATVMLEEKEGKRHLLSPSCSALPADDVASEIPDEQLSTDLHSSLKPQTVTLTCTVSKSIDPSCQPPSQLDESPSCGLVTPQLMKAAHDSADLPKEEPASEMAASDQPIPFTEQRTSNTAFVPLGPGPMLSHLESIADSDVILPEQMDYHAADGSSTKMHDENSREVTQMSLAQDAKHSDIIAQETCSKMEDRNVVVDNSVMNNVNVQFSQEENLPPAAVRILAGSDQVIFQSPTEPDSAGIKPVICDSPTKDELINVSCPLSAALPTCQSNDDMRRGGLTEKHKAEDDTYLLWEEETKQAEELTVDSQKETDSRLQSGKSGATPQQSNGPDKEAVNEIGALLPSHKHRDSESPPKDLEVEGSEKESWIASKSKREACLLSADRDAGLPAEVQPGREPWTVCEGSCRAEHGSDTDTAQSVALGQPQSTPDPDCFAQQQDQQQRFLGSRHPPEELPGGCLEEGEKTKSQVRQIRALALGVNGTTEEIVSSAGSLEQVIRVEKGEAEGGQAAPGVGGVDLSTHPASSLNGTATVDRDGVTTCSLVGDTRQGMGENKGPGLWAGGSALGPVSDAEFLSDHGDIGQQKSNLSVACQEQHRTPGASTDTAVSVESASQEHATSPLQISVTSEVSTESNGSLTNVWVNVEEVHRELSSTLPDPVRQPETVENDSSAANVVKSNSSETEECEIQHTVCEPLKLQSPSIPSATQSSDGAKTAIKGPGVEIPEEDKAALAKERACSQGTGQNEIKAKKTEGRDKEEVVNPTGSVEDDGFGSIKFPDLCNSGVSLLRTDTGPSEGDTGPSSVTENGSDGTDKTSPEVVTVPSVASSNCIQKHAPPPPAAPTQPEQLHVRTPSPKPKDDIVSSSVVAAPQSERRSPEKDLACNSAVHQQCVNAETGDLSESPAPEITAQEPNTSWIKALREAASQSESKQESTVDTRR